MPSRHGAAGELTRPGARRAFHGVRLGRAQRLREGLREEEHSKSTSTSKRACLSGPNSIFQLCLTGCREVLLPHR